MEPQNTTKYDPAAPGIRRIMLKVAYDGTEYCGWQLQPKGRTIEGELNRELSRLLREDIHVQGCSRTDAGVHGKGNLCVFDTAARIPPEKICYAINQSLPDDIVVVDSMEVPTWFHPRKWDSRKTYEYSIYTSRFPDPMLRRYAYCTYVPLDVNRMKEAAPHLIGEHDFASFCASGSSAKTTVRTILSLEVMEREEKIVIRVTGTGFLYNMVRIIAGTLMAVGRGRFEPSDVKAILEACDRSKAGPTAPAEGLCLKQIELIDPPWKNVKTGENHLTLN